MACRAPTMLEAGIGIGIGVDAIGLQGHRHQGCWGEEKTHRVLETGAEASFELDADVTVRLGAAPSTP